MNLFDLTAKVAIVTGATGLLGKEHCAALSDAGAFVVVADLDQTKCRAVARELGDRAMPLVLDVTSRQSLNDGLRAVLKQHGSVDVLVSNAAVNDMFENPALAGELSKFENYPEESWRKMFDVNVTGTFLCSQVFGTEMARRRSGSIINIASTYGIVGPDQALYRRPDGAQAFYKSPAYPATKGAVIAFTRFLAAYWGNQGVRVNTLSPGGVENAQDDYFVRNYSSKTPLGRMAAPGDYRGAIVFLASDASAYMTGANLIVDGGWTAI
jgi:NAD(P)-dependent dehydrogenase (short-subunit alcohol dehydrogenase family)